MLSQKQQIQNFKRIITSQEQKLADLSEEIRILKDQNFSIKANYQRERQKNQRSRDKVANVDIIINQRVQQKLKQEQDRYNGAQAEMAQISEEVKILRQENRRLFEEKRSLNQRIIQLQSKLQRQDGDQRFQDPSIEIETLHKKDIVSAGELEKRTKQLNEMGRRMQDLDLENRFLRQMAGVPENYGKKELQQFEEAEQRRIGDWKRMFRHYEKEMQQMERERARLRAQLRQMAALAGNNDDIKKEGRYRGLNAQQSAKVQEFIIKIRMNQNVDAQLKSEFQIMKENEKLRDQNQLLKQEILSNLNNQAHVVKKSGGVIAMQSGDEEMQKQILIQMEQLNSKINETMSKFQNVQQDFAPAMPQNLLQVDGAFDLSRSPMSGIEKRARFFQPLGSDQKINRPVQPLVRPGGHVESSYTYRFQGEIPVKPFDYDKDPETNKYDFAFLQGQLLEVMELNSRQNGNDKDIEIQLDRINNKLRNYILQQDQIYKSYICWKNEASSENKRLLAENKQLRLDLSEAKLKGESLNIKINKVLSSQQGSEKAKIIELTKQNALLQFNLQKISSKFSFLEEQQKMLRAAYHQVEPEYAERITQLTQSLLKLQTWKREAIYNLRFLLNKLQTSVSCSQYQNLQRDYQTLKQKYEHFTIKETTLRKKLTDLEYTKRENFKLLKKVREIEDMRMDAEAEVESLKKRLETIDPSFHWQISIMNRILMTLRRFKMSPQHIFQYFDKSGDGKLSKSQFQQALNQMRINDLSPREFDGLLGQLDIDRDGCIRYKEFVNRLSRYGVKSRTTEQQIIYTMNEIIQRKGISLINAFKIFDRDGSGLVSKEEFKDSLKNMQIDLEQKQIDRIVSHIIGKVQNAGSTSAASLKRSQGGIDYFEFAKLFDKKIKQMQDEEQQRNARGIPKSQMRILHQQVFLQIQRHLTSIGQTIQQAFQRIDIGRDGKVSKSELEQFFSNSGVHLRENQFQAFFQKLDFDNDGVISAYQFDQEYQNAKRQMDISTSIAQVGEQQFGSDSTNELMRLRTQVAVLQTRERNLQNNYGLQNERLKDSENHNNRLQNSIDDYYKQNIELSQNLHIEKERVRKLDQQLKNSILNEQATQIKLRCEKLTIENNQRNAACTTYKSLYLASVNQVKLLTLAGQRRKDESHSLYNALRQLQTKSPEHKQFGKLYYIIMLQRWQEAAANRKYDEVLNDMKSLQNEKLDLEERLQAEESFYFNSQKLLQLKVQEIAQIKQELVRARNRFLTLEKSEEFMTIIRQLSDGKELVEEEIVTIKQDNLDLLSRLDQAQMRSERAQDLMSVLRNGSSTELSNKLLEISDKFAQMKRKQLKAVRELQMIQEKEKYLSRINGKLEDNVKKLEQSNSQMTAKVARVEEQMRKRDNQRQQLFFDNAMSAEKIKTPGFSPQVPQIFKASSRFQTFGPGLANSPQQLASMRAKAHAAASSRRSQNEAPVSQNQEAKISEMSMKINELGQNLAIAQAQLRSKNKQLDRREQWKNTDSALFNHQEKFRELVQTQYSNLQVTHEAEQRNMSQAAQKIINTLRQVIDNKDKMLRRKDESLNKMRQDLKLQKEKDANEIARLNNKLSNTGQTTLNKLKDVVEQNKRLGNRMVESSYMPEQAKIFQKQMEHTIQEKNRQLNQANIQLNEMKNKVSKLSENIDYMHADLEHEKRKNDVQIVKKELGRAKKTIASKENEINGLKNAILELKQQILDHTNKLSAKQEDLTAKILAQASAQNQLKQNKGQKAKNDMLRTRNNKLNTQLKGAKERALKLEAQLGESQREVEILKKRLSDIESQRSIQMKSAAPGGRAQQSKQPDPKSKILQSKLAAQEKEVKNTKMILLIKEKQVDELKKQITFKEKEFQRELMATKRKMMADNKEKPVRDTDHIQLQKRETELIQSVKKQEQKKYRREIESLQNLLDDRRKQIQKNEITISHWKVLCQNQEKQKREYEDKIADIGKSAKLNELSGTLFVNSVSDKNTKKRYAGASLYGNSQILEDDEFNHRDI